MTKRRLEVKRLAITLLAKKNSLRSYLLLKLTHNELAGESNLVLRRVPRLLSKKLVLKPSCKGVGIKTLLFLQISIPQLWLWRQLGMENTSVQLRKLV